MATAKQRKAHREAIKLASADDLKRYAAKSLPAPPPKPATNPTDPKASNARPPRS